MEINTSPEGESFLFCCWVNCFRNLVYVERMKKTFQVTITFFVFNILSPLQAQHFQLEEVMESRSPSGLLQILKVDDAALSIEEVAAMDEAGLFQPVENESLGRDYFDKHFWVKLPVENRSSGEIVWYVELQYPLLYQVDLYAPSGRDAKSYEVKKSGLLTPIEERELQHRKITFEVKTAAGARENLYLHVYSKVIPHIAMRVWTKEPLREYSSRIDDFYSMYLHIIFTIVIINIIIWYYSGHLIYLMYSLFLALLTLFQMAHLGYQLFPIWPNNFWSNGIISYGYIRAIFDAQFVVMLLSVREKVPRVYKVVRWTIVLMAVSGIVSTFVASPFFPFVSLIILSLLTGSFAVTTYVLIREKYSAIYFFLIAKSVYLAATTIFTLSVHGWFSLSDVVYVVYILGTLFEAVIFFISLIKIYTSYEAENYILQYKSYRNRAFPHFLFNSLNSLYEVIDEGRNKTVKRLISQLIGVYHFITYKSLNETATLSEELEFCRQYMEIMKIRFSDMITYETRVHANVESIDIPPFLIQSFLENAIKHGFNGEKAIHIDVTIEGSKKGVVIEIENDGRLFSKEPSRGETVENMVALLKLLYQETQINFVHSEEGKVKTVIEFAGKIAKNMRWLNRN